MNKKTRKIELLAPAKNLETAIAAINFGADAVYIGAEFFGARHSAGNSIEDIKKLVDYAHLFNVKVHVTVNTIFTDEETEKVKELISTLYKTNVDAIIVQDMGIINLAIKKEIPPIQIHASTQCNNRTKEKVKFFENIGLSRVILARELSLEKIKEICNEVKCEIETFVHGALCVSYSGQCYMSCFIGGRSANRGECAQPCRKKYTLIDEKGNIISKDKYLLSMKDFNASKQLSDLLNIGVYSLKIEGRLKDINYVKNVVLYYRQELDKISQKTSSGKIFTDIEPNIEKSFNRGFTTYFLNNREKCSNIDSPKVIGEKICTVKKSGFGWFEPYKKIKLNNQDGICFFLKKELAGCLINKYQDSRIYINKKIKIDENTIIYRNFDYEYDKKLTHSKTVRKISVIIEYKNNKIIFKDEDNNKVEYKITKKEKAQNQTKNNETFIKQMNKTGDSVFYVEKIEILEDLPFLKISEQNEIRRQMFEKLKDLRISKYITEKQKPLKYSEYPISEINYLGNVHNKEAQEFYEKCSAQVIEKSLESTKSFNDKELMRTKYCLKHYFDICKSPKKLFLIDEKGQKYKLEFDCKNCEMVIKKA